MCLIALAWKTSPRYRLALIANRDERHARASAAAGSDPEAADVHGGRDLVSGGGWLQVSTRGRLAAVTNVRNGLAADSAPHSRGWLVRDFVRGDGSAPAHATALQSTASEYGRFNLLLWDGCTLAFAGNHPRPAQAIVAPGMHAMSNGAFDAPWPKSSRALRALERWLQTLGTVQDPARDRSLLEPLFSALYDTAIAPDAELPDTGIGLSLERRLSPPFIVNPEYGTRCSTVVLAGDAHIVFAERRFAPDGSRQGDSFAVLPLGPAGAP